MVLHTTGFQTLVLQFSMLFFLEHVYDYIPWLTPLPRSPPLACGSNSIVSSLLGVSRRRSGLAPAWRRRLRARARLPPPPLHPSLPSKGETVELLPHANGGVGGFLNVSVSILCAEYPRLRQFFQSPQRCLLDSTPSNFSCVAQ